MNCFDIHTHRFPSRPEQAIVSHAIGSALPGGRVAYLSVGIHPWYLDAQQAESQLATLRQSLQDDRVVALGEAGLDRLRGCPLDVQISVFRHEVALAEEYGLPMVIHSVRAFNELIQLKKELRPRQPWIIHGFRGKEGVALDLLRHDCYLSFGARFQEEAVRAVPLERLFIETDEAPESIGDVCRSIAQVRGVSPEELAEAVNKNVREVFFKH
jgi:TatD DNase family protein